MRISLVTFHCAWSYGALLQTYALCRFLEQAGHEVEIADYRPDSIARPRDWRQTRFHGLHPAHLEWWLLRRRFEDFRVRHLRRSRIVYRTFAELQARPPEADAYVCGSDQIWNPALLGDVLDPAYFLDFAPAGTRRIAYAASLGGNDLPAAQHERFRDLLSRLDRISCREEEASAFVEKTTGRQAATVLDPTFLQADYLQALALHPPRAGRPYLFAYPLFVHPEALAAIAAAGRELDCPVRIVNGMWKFWAQPGRPAYPGPAGWLRLVHDARAVVTSSFHGTAFAILFQKNFVTLPLVGEMSVRNTRIVRLLESLGLRDRLVHPSDLATIRRTLRIPIDWQSIHARLADRRAHSGQFLRDALS